MLGTLQFLATVAWRNLSRHRRRTLITASAMALGVALCMASMCIQDGFFVTMFDVLVEQQIGHLQVDNPKWKSSRVMNDTIPGASLLERIDAQPGTVVAAPRLSGFALLGTESRSQGAMLMGVDPAREVRMSGVDARVVSGRFLAEGATAEIVLGERLAEDLGVAVGGEVVAVTQAADGSLGNALYTIVGTLRTGNAQLDRGGAMLHVADLQELLVLPDQLHSVTVVTDDVRGIEAYAARLREGVGSETVEVLPWWEASPLAKQMMDMSNVSAVLVLGVVFVAAGFGVLNTMMMSVLERTRELGVLKALGMRPARIVGLVVVESLFLACIAGTLGFLLGGAFDAYLVFVGIDLAGGTSEHGLEFGGIVLDPIVKGAFLPQKVALTLGALVVVSLLSSLWPAGRAARLEPVASLRAD